MITSKDVRQEIKDARTVIDSDASTADKLKVLFKIVEVGIKIVLGTRVNVVKVMEKLGVEKVQPRKPRENDTKKTPDTEKPETKE